MSDGYFSKSPDEYLKLSFQYLHAYQVFFFQKDDKKNQNLRSIKKIN